MAEKRFYSFVETCQRLGKTEEEVWALIRSGKLNPLRSGQRGPMNFRVDEVNGLVGGGAKKKDDFDFMDELAEVEGSPSDALTLESGGDVGLSETIGLGVNPEDEDLGLSESFLPPGTTPVAIQDEGEVIASEPAAASDTGEELPLSSESFGFSTDEVEAIQESPTVAEQQTLAETPPAAPAKPAKQPAKAPVAKAPPPPAAAPTKISPTLGGSDVIDIEEVDAAARAAAADDTVITQVGINVFDDREVKVETDPLADTVITPSPEDQLSMEGAGSGSGLLDLSREEDGTSFGQVLDEIAVPEAAAAGSTIGSEIAAESDVGSIAAVADEEAEEVEDVAGPAEVPVFAGMAREVEATDPTAPVYSWLAGAGFVVTALAMFVMAVSMRGVAPDFVKALRGSWGWTIAGIALGVVIVVAIPIYILGSSKARQMRAIQELQG